MKKRIIASLLTASMLAAALAGCGGSTAQTADTSADAAGEAESAQGDPATVTEKETNVSATADADLSGTTITFWHSMSGVNGEALTALVDQFNEENTYGITVDAEFEGEYDDAINKLKSSMVGGSGPDLIQVYEIGTRFMIDSGWVISMQELMDANGYDNSNIVPNIAAYYTIDDQLYAMPFNTSTPILYYNKDMFDAAGITEVPTSLEGIDAIADDLVNKERHFPWESTDGSLSSLSASRDWPTQTMTTEEARRRQPWILTATVRLSRSYPPGRISTTRDMHRMWELAAMQV